MKLPEFVVLQMGARLHYGVPTVLAQRGMLRRLYTDVVGDRGVVGSIGRVVPAILRPRKLRRLLGRAVPREIADAALTTAALRTLLTQVAAPLMRLGLTPATPHSVLRDQVLRDKFCGATALYCVDNSDLPLMREARDRGLLVVYEQIINGDVGRILRDERARYPGIESQEPIEEIEGGIQRDREVWACADLIVVASEFVKDGMVAWGVESAKIAVVPYGIHREWLDVPRGTQAGRVLFVGTVGLRKGNHYLAQATRLLRSRGITCEVQVVGPAKPETLRHPEFRGPTYVGQIPRGEVRRMFAEADVFVLPTLSESFGLVHLEALACGVPVITTPACGSVVRDGVEGFIVPVRDPEALASRIEQVICDRALRERLSQAAHARAAEFTWERYGERLAEAIMTAWCRRDAARARPAALE